MAGKGITVTDELIEYLLAHSLERTQVHRDLVTATNEAMGDRAIMQISPEQGPFLTFLARLRLERAGVGRQEDVAEVRHTGARKVRVGEAQDAPIAGVVAAAAVPVRRVGPGVRGKLHHPRGRRGPREGVAVAPGADEGIHQGGQGLRGPRRRGTEKGAGHQGS